MDGVQIQDQLVNIIGLEEFLSGQCDLKQVLYFSFYNLLPLLCMWKIEFQCITVSPQKMMGGWGALEV